MKGNRQGFLSRSITRRSDQNSKIKYCFFILLFCRQLVGKVRTGFFDKLRPPASHEAGGLSVPFQFFFHRCSVRISTADSSGFARCAVMPAS